MTIAEMQEIYDALKAAYIALIGGVKSYNLSTGSTSRSLQYRDLPEIKTEMDDWARRIAVARAGSRTKYIVPKC